MFVTRHSDFESRAKSSLSGARDLMGKPFLTFEVAVKALTMVMRRRLEADPREKTDSGAPSEAPKDGEAIPAETEKRLLEPVI